MIVERNTFVNDDCMHIMKYMSDNCVDMTLTDIPFGVVNRHNGLRRNNMDKGAADIETFNAVDFIKQVYRITKSNIIVFCAKEQLSDIYKFFVASGGGYNSADYMEENKSSSDKRTICLFKRNRKCSMVS